MGNVIRIGIDTRDLKKARTGTYIYLNEICQAFKRIESKEIEFIFIEYPLPVYSGKSYFLKSFEHLFFFLWKQLALPFICRSKECEVLFCTDYFLPVYFFKGKKIAVFHDCFFFDHPEYYNAFWLKMFHRIGLAGARKAFAIVTPSDYVRKRLEFLQPDLIGKIKVVYEGHADLGNLVSEEKTDDAWSQVQSFVGNNTYFLYVGTLDKRKNLDRLILAYQKLPQQISNNLKLIIAGSSPPYKKSDSTNSIRKLVRDLKLGEHILLTGRVSPALLKKLYSHAMFLVQPSLDEGFGLTITEALHFGIPFIAADNTAMPEIGGEAGLYFNPYKIDDISNTIAQISQDRELRDQLKEKGEILNDRYNWDTAAAELLKIFNAKKI